MQDIRIAILQVNLHWEDKEANFNLFDKSLKELDGVDFVLLPETFTTGFSMNTEKLAEPMEGKTLAWLKKWSKFLDAVICGSYIVEEAGECYNRLVAIEPNGSYQYYDKRHLFRMGGEMEAYSSGDKKITINHKGWKVNPFICYDLRFPVWCRNTNDAEMMVFVSNWPEVRSEHWLSLLKARAIENQCFVLGSNRVGEDGKGVTHSGNSVVFNPKGEKVEELINKEGLILLSLKLEDVQNYRTVFPAYLDRDQFELKS